MNKFNFIKTGDGTIGLFNNLVNDIYHAKEGALSEAVRKFIIPSNFIDYCKNHRNVNILDICYGIGYNTKTAMYFAKQINKNIKINIDALEIDKELIYLSPFVKDGIPNIDLKLSLLKSIIERYGIDENCLSNIDDIIRNNCNCFSNLYAYYKRFYELETYKSKGNFSKSAFLHNIYYLYISNSMKNTLKTALYRNSNISFFNTDARKSIDETDSIYDFVFLDAFTPQKDPTLWTIDFLSKIKKHMNKNSVLISYSTSTPFRAALLELGFCVGKSINNNTTQGTIASLNRNKIKYPLDLYEIGLTKTTAGITFKDSNLNLSKIQIIQNHTEEQKKSDRISTTKYKSINR